MSCASSHCRLFQASRQSPLPAMLVGEAVVVGFTDFAAGWRTQLVKYGNQVSPTLRKICNVSAVM